MYNLFAAAFLQQLQVVLVVVTQISRDRPRAWLIARLGTLVLRSGSTYMEIKSLEPSRRVGFFAGDEGSSAKPRRKKRKEKRTTPRKRTPIRPVPLSGDGNFQEDRREVPEAAQGDPEAA